MEDTDKEKEMRREEMKEEKEKKAQESIYLRIEKCMLAYSVTSGASQRRDASAFLFLRSIATRHVVRSIIFERG